MTGSLAELLDAARARVAALRPRRGALRAAATEAPHPRSWGARFGGSEVAVIAEIKRRSPSAGTIAAGLSAGTQARAYVAGGAAAISVLTEGPHFGGSLADLDEVSRSVEVPLLRKDFVIDEAQLFEARIYGASAVLLIVRALDPGQLADLAASARELGLARLVEVHDARELERALAVTPDAVGINARDLDTFAVDVDRIAPVVGAVPAGVIAVAESGLSSRGDVERVAAWGADAVLVGGALAGAANPSEAVRRLVGVARRGRARPVGERRPA